MSSALPEWRGHKHEQLILWAQAFCVAMLNDRLYESQRKYYTVLKYNIEMGPKFYKWTDEEEVGFRGLQWLRDSMRLDDRFKHLSEYPLVGKN